MPKEIFFLDIVFKLMTIDIINTKSGNIKSGPTLYNEYCNKLKISRTFWRNKPISDPSNIHNRFLLIFASQEYVNEWFKNEESKLNKKPCEKMEKHLAKTRHKFKFFKRVYFLLWDINSEVSKQWINQNYEIQQLVKNNQDKLFFTKIDDAIEQCKKEFKHYKINVTRTEFFNMNKLFMKELTSYKKLKKMIFNFLNKIKPKDKTPHKLNLKYSDKALYLVALAYDLTNAKQHKLTIQTLTSIIRNCARSGETYENITFYKHIFSTISDKTVIKALKIFSKTYSIKLKVKKIKIKLRDYRLQELGYCQLDLKTFTQNEYKILCKRIYSIDLIDECSNFMYAEFTMHPTAINIVAFLKRAIAYFAKHGIIIKQIKTDSCNIFAAKAGSEHERFVNCLAENNIKHVVIPFQRPQHNGKVERLHKTYDDEIKAQLYNKTFEECQMILSNYVEYYNNVRITYTWKSIVDTLL